ncbi:MAG: TatD family hydrolase [Candidatus Zixiibacteriota bacterium]|nr:MAG: TatD family hydrolase [candidate division Zixibacteria bacterium]
MIDSHCHLDFDAFDGRRDQVIREALDAGIHTIINIGVDVRSSVRSIELAAGNDCIFATVGIHPHDAKTLDDEAYTRLEELAVQKKVVAIGEIGLDFYRDLSPRQVQKNAFHKQLELAVELELPVVIHTRDSFGETVKIVQQYASRLPGGVFHCFPGDLNDARRIIKLGFIISVGGVITYRDSRMSRVAAAVDLDKIILETDAPYLTPEPLRGKTNTPVNVKYVCRKLAELKGIGEKEVEMATDRTCRRLFKLVETFEG